MTDSISHCCFKLARYTAFDEVGMLSCMVTMYRSERCLVVAIHCKVKTLKFTLVQALRLCTGRTAHRGSRGIGLPVHDHGTRRGWGVSVTPRPLFTPGKDPVTIVQEAGWDPEPVWTGAENLAPPAGFYPRTVQPVASRYTAYVTRRTIAGWPRLIRLSGRQKTTRTLSRIAGNSARFLSNTSSESQR